MLTMRVGNLHLQLRSREDELEALKASCDGELDEEYQDELTEVIEQIESLEVR